MQMAIVQDQAAHSYNYGLRSYYFAMSTLAWFVHPLLFAFSCSAVVVILYKREFKSNTLKVMCMIDEVEQRPTEKT